jgi:SAM-dependent methyltransferase
MPGPPRFSSLVYNIQSINHVVDAFSKAFAPQGPILEVGSYYPAGYEHLCNRRRFFPGMPYTGCDLRDGLGVDRVEDAQKLSFADDTFAAVVMLETLEHLPHPERALSEASRVLRKEGLLLLSVPFDYRLHGFPHDYRRLTSSGLYSMLEEFPNKTVVALGPSDKPATVFAVAGKSGTVGFKAAAERFQALLRADAGEIARKQFWIALEHRSRELLGLLSGRARVTVAFYNPNASGGYEFDLPK